MHGIHVSNSSAIQRSYLTLKRLALEHQHSLKVQANTYVRIHQNLLTRHPFSIQSSLVADNNRNLACDRCKLAHNTDKRMLHGWFRPC